MSLYTVDTPFTWGMALAALRDRNIDLPVGLNDVVGKDEFTCLMDFRDINELFYVRDWFAERKHIVFRLYGHIIMDTEAEEREETFEKFVGIRFVFQNEDEMAFFTMACHNGLQIAA